MRREFVKELHKQARQPKVYRKVVSLGVDDTWSIDLVDMRYIDGRENEKKQLELNDGYQYIFMCIDLFSRYGWAPVPMKNKTTTEAWSAFSKIVGERKPKKIWADQGGEFHGDFWEKNLEIWCRLRAEALRAVLSVTPSRCASGGLCPLVSVTRRAQCATSLLAVAQCVPRAGHAPAARRSGTL